MLIKVNGEVVPFTEFPHQHGRPHDLFVKIERTLKGGDDVTYEGDLPEGITDLWVRFPYENWKGEAREGAWGNLRLSSRSVRLRKTTEASK